MFDIGWGEFFLIGVVALIVVGPKELPGLFRTAGQWTGKARGMAREFQRSLEQAANESGMNEVSQSLKSIEGVNLRSPTKAARNLAAKAMTPSESPETKPEPAAEPAPVASAPATSAPVIPATEPAVAAEPAPREGKSAAS
jgi:sec-independent protein translocase protein TatB